MTFNHFLINFIYRRKFLFYKEKIMNIHDFDGECEHEKILQSQEKKDQRNK